MVRQMIILFVVVVVAVACSATPGTGSTTPSQPTVSNTPSMDALVAEMDSQSVFQQSQPTVIPQSVIDVADAEHMLLANLYERLAPSVVFVEVIVGEEDQFALRGVGNGSGFIYDLDGHIVTNAHVVKDADQVNVTFNDGYIVPAEVIGYDTYSDIAVLKIETDVERLQPIPLGDSDATRVGERAIVIGNPFGLASSMTTGIISAKGRQLPSAELIDASVPGGFQNPSIIQVDADINPGNSGGPLLNSQGEVIGVNTAIRTETGVFEGVGFAVPSSTVQRVVPELIEDSQVNYAWIGISAMSAADGFGVASLAEVLELPVSAGVMLSTVTPDSPADKAGLLGGTETVMIRGREICVGGDIIVSVNEQIVRTMDELVTYLVTYSQPDDTIVVRVIRDGEPLDLEVLLEARPTGSLPPAFCGG